MRVIILLQALPDIEPPLGKRILLPGPSRKRFKLRLDIPYLAFFYCPLLPPSLLWSKGQIEVNLGDLSGITIKAHRLEIVPHLAFMPINNRVRGMVLSHLFVY